MPKKESSKRGYMTRREIISHLDGLKTKEKSQYLNKILEKKGLLARETYASVSELNEDLYAKIAQAYVQIGPKDTIKYAEKIKDENLRKEVYEKAAKESAKKGWAESLDYAERSGNSKLIDKMFVLAAENLTKKKWFGGTKESTTTWKGGRPTSALMFANKIKDKKLREETYHNIIEKAIEEGFYDDAEKVAMDTGTKKLNQIYEKLVDKFERKEFWRTAKSIRFRLENLKSKK